MDNSSVFIISETFSNVIFFCLRCSDYKQQSCVAAVRQLNMWQFGKDALNNQLLHNDMVKVLDTNISPSTEATARILIKINKIVFAGGQWDERKGHPSSPCFFFPLHLSLLMKQRGLCRGEKLSFVSKY